MWYLWDNELFLGLVKNLLVWQRARWHFCRNWCTVERAIAQGTRTYWQCCWSWFTWWGWQWFSFLWVTGQEGLLLLFKGLHLLRSSCPFDLLLWSLFVFMTLSTLLFFLATIHLSNNKIAFWYLEIYSFWGIKFVLVKLNYCLSIKILT